MEPPSSVPLRPAYRTDDPLFCGPPLNIARPPAARDRIVASLPLQGLCVVLPIGALIAFEVLHRPPPSSGPRHTRQVPTRTFVFSAGSSRAGGSVSDASPLTCETPIDAEPLKSVALQSFPFAQACRATPAPACNNQLRPLP